MRKLPLLVAAVAPVLAAGCVERTTIVAAAPPPPPVVVEETVVERPPVVVREIVRPAPVYATGWVRSPRRPWYPGQGLCRAGRWEYCR